MHDDDTRDETRDDASSEPASKPESEIAKLIRRYAGGRNSTELARDSGGLLSMQVAWDYLEGRAAHNRLPANRTIRGLSDALRLYDDTPTLMALARSSRGEYPLRIRPVPAIVQEMPYGVEVFDHHPDLRAAILRMLAEQVALLSEQRGE